MPQIGMLPDSVPVNVWWKKCDAVRKAWQDECDRLHIVIQTAIDKWSECHDAIEGAEVEDKPAPEGDAP